MPDRTRRAFLLESFAVLSASTAAVRAFAQTKSPPKPSIVVYKAAGCVCCQVWVDHMQAAGYKATVNNEGMEAIKSKHKIPPALQSCHTTLVGGYVIEGHVPHSDVARLLKEKPQGVVGLTIPGMPASAPGMDQIPFEPYRVLAFDAKGSTTVFAVHNKPPR
jgi:hypothetical protein